MATNKELETILLNNVESIKARALMNIDIAEAINRQSLLIKKMELTHQDVVINEKELGKSKYSNAEQRQIALNKLLDIDLTYQEACKSQDEMGRNFKIAQVELDYLHDLFRANIAIANLQSSR